MLYGSGNSKRGFVSTWGGGRGREMGGRFKREGLYVYLWVYKKDLHHQDNHDDVITHLEPDILECEVKWALESITASKASRGDRIPTELF